MGRRTKGTKKRYIVHAGRDYNKTVPGLFNDKQYKKGQIIDNVSKGRSLKQDRRTKSKRTVKSGYGHLGDLKIVRKTRRDGVRQRYHVRKKGGDVQIETRIYFNDGGAKKFEDYGDTWSEPNASMTQLKRWAKESATERFRKKYPYARIIRLRQ